ncbi:putative outer membrane protein probably involved in nutrient binding protein [Lunatimonas lonarensis]|uniref:Putative outer membrane protein probably involved in nutrient binding protein n=1 Tax=Lunatimonas lonarensis TaxID=1232681 RepID=R7ZU81_9BACT|nr:RagB/SusD family nutrient uptake outer membrane protein [Lunatimonas lonarensis]EON77588.1 putative outer membrane protein probably involved in nutrient binding protein [Lunatimonas lonarensis]
MKMKASALLFSIICTASTLSCTDLETTPRQSLTPEVALSDVAGYQAVANSMYSLANTFTYYGQQMMIAPEILADNLRLVANTGRYQGEEANGDRDHIGLWNGIVYGGINDANIILAGIDDENVRGEQADKDIIKGEAFFMRALFYFDLCRVYGYEPGKEVNGFDLGPILRTTPTLAASDADFRARSTVLQVYEQIESDLLESISLLPLVPVGSEGVYYANAGAALTLLARLYLYWGRMQDAEAAATTIMNALGLRSNGDGLLEAGQYVQGFSRAPHPESVFELELRVVDWSSVDGVNNSLNSLTSNTDPSAQFIIAASNELMAAYEPQDVRRNCWAETTRDGIEGPVFASRKWTGFKGDFLENIPVIRAAELYLIRAEARYQSNPAGARADINALRSKRGLGPIDNLLSGQALFNRILLERRLEFALEGHRFFDLKRNGLNITKHANFEEVPYTDYRILSNIPLAQVQLNDRLVQNPGY